MANYLKMPKLGMTMEEGTIVQWMKQEGDSISLDDILFETETDKLHAEVNGADAGLEKAGILLKIIAAPGEIIPVLENVAIAGEVDEDISKLL
jgi:pyruvate dehydrogenase E2 component (dihydrolipoamide acetyltransferase)